ncbi:dihydroxyacetone kinase phosphoryl donor subunit DhaM [Actinokineospora enzanensis]|uniref:dihydroxyacetone kinase phosphoryl donor subunit DhaM n=1 Tax=Actinokineospora enzanensis TaxID=155975 RepID=UPI00035CD88D|nr:dihydroxyacetone kinase phosphoryl donor subunit DhaM [Actinokineospora enzanensis]
MRVGLVVVSHSAKLAEGVAELAAQMAPDVVIVPAGGLDGTLGTDYDAVTTAISSAQRGAGVALLYDLGSAKMTADLAVETLGDPSTAAVVDAPLVEGAVAAAVAAQAGGSLDYVISAAASALALEVDDGELNGTEFVLTNELGLHARPASAVVRALTGLDADVAVTYAGKTADARSVLNLLALGVPAGGRIQVAATGPDAPEALNRIANLIARDFS